MKRATKVTAAQALAALPAALWLIDQRDAEERERRLQSEALTFEQAARQVYADLKPGFKNAKHVDHTNGLHK